MEGLRLRVEKSSLISELSSHLVSGGRYQFEGTVTFSAEWQGRSATVCFDAGDISRQVAVVDGRFDIPDEVIATGRFTLGIVSVGQADTYVTNLLYISAIKGGNSDGTVPAVPTPTVWETYVLQVEDYVTSANTSATLAQTKAQVAVDASAVAVQAKADGQAILADVNIAKDQVATDRQTVLATAGQVENQATAVGENAAAVLDAKIQVNATGQTIQTLAGQVIAQSAAVAENTATVQAVKTQVTATGQTVQTLAGQVEANAVAVGANATAVQTAKTQVDEAKQTVSALATQVDTQATAVTADAATVQTAKIQAVAAQQAIYNMDVTVDTLDPSQSATVEKIQNDDGSITLAMAVPQGTAGVVDYDAINAYIDEKTSDIYLLLDETAEALQFKNGGVASVATKDIPREIRKLGASEYTFTFAPPYVLLNTVGIEPDVVEIYGDSEQDVTTVPDSPSPDYPAEIRSVGGEVAVQGKNLFDITQAVSTAFVANGDGTYTFTADGGYGFANRVAVDIPANTPYTLSIDCGEKSETDHPIGIVRAKSDGTNGCGGIHISGNTRNSTVYTHDYDVVSLRFYLEGWTSGDYVEINNIQLELGSEATDYTLYVEPTTIEVPTLYGIGDVKDVMYIDREQERAWVERNFSVYIHDGVVSAAYSAYSKCWRVYADVMPVTAYMRKPMLCDKSPTIAENPNKTIDNLCTQKQKNFQFYFPWGFGGSEFGVSTAEELLEIANVYLSQYAPFTFVYQVEPYIEELDYTDYKFLTAENATTITMSGDVMPQIELTIYVSAIPDPSTSYLAQVLTSLGVEPADTLEGQADQLDELDVDPYA